MTQCDLSVAGSPIILLVVQTSATSVIVEWSQPSGGATVTGYVVHYSDGVVNNAKSIPDPTSTCHSIRNLTWCSNYTFSVEAASEHISGISETFALEFGEFSCLLLILFICLFFDYRLCGNNPYSLSLI